MISALDYNTSGHYRRAWAMGLANRHMNSKSKSVNLRAVLLQRCRVGLDLRCLGSPALAPEQPLL